jgi:pilus assembly protein CpaE
MSGLTLVSNDSKQEDRLSEVLGDQIVRRVWAETWQSSPEAAAVICAADPLVVAIGADVLDDDAIELLRAIDIHRPEIGVVVLRTGPTQETTLKFLRQGAREVIDANQAADSVVRDTIDRVFALVGERLTSLATAPEQTRRIIAVLSPKGGTGKTTISTNLAVGLARKMPNQVLLIDLDLQFGDVASALGLVPEHSLKDAVGTGHVDLTSLKVFLTRHDSGLAVLTPPQSLAEAEEIDPDGLKRTLAALSDEFPVIILDTAAGIDEYAFVALEFASDLLFVSTTDVPSIRAIAKQIEALDRLSMIDAERIFLLNRSDAKVGLSQSDIEATLGMKADHLVPSSRVIPLSTNQGVPHIDSKANDAPAKSLQHLVDAFPPPPVR